MSFVFVDQNEKRYRIAARLHVTLALKDGIPSGPADIEITYAPSGETELPPPGTQLETVAQGKFRVSISTHVELALQK